MGLLGDIGGFFGARSDRKAAQAASDRAYWTNRTQAAKAREELTAGAAEARLYDDKALAGIEKASAQMRTMGVMGGQNLRNQMQVSMGNVQQNMANRGMGNTTLGANLQRGVLGDYGQQMAQFTSGIMGQQANASGLLANAQVGYGQRRYDEMVDMAQSRLGTTYTAGDTPTGSADAYASLGNSLGESSWGQSIQDWWTGS